MALAGLGHQVEDERGVDDRFLAGLEIAESFDVRVETGSDFFSGGFIGQGCRHVEVFRWVKVYRH